MKKSLIALAVMAASGAAMAQSSVTIWGLVDLGVTRGSGSIADKTAMTASNQASSQLGFRGTEDLGGGMAAHFWFESQFDFDSGNSRASSTNNQATGTSAATAGTQGLTFSRRSTVSVTGGFGEIRLGRDYTPQFWNLTAYDPFGTNGIGTNLMLPSAVTVGSGGGTTGPTVRASNSITYLYNHGKNDTYAAGNAGLHAAVQMYMGENASNVANNNDGNGYGIRVGYNAGPLSLAVATGKTTYLAGNATMTNIGASYNLGVATVMAQVSRDELGTVKGDGYLIGATAPMGAGLIKASYSTYKNKATGAEPSKFALGYIHNLSKRTSLYGHYANVSNKGGSSTAVGGATTAANASSNAYEVGVRHSF